MDNQLLNHLQPGKLLSESDQAVLLDAFEYRTSKEGATLFQSGHICRQPLTSHPLVLSNRPFI